MPEPTYTVIAYRPNGLDTCMNCEMGRSDSQLEIEYFTEAEDAAEYAATVLFCCEQEKRREYAGWELTYLINGEECWQGEVEALADKALKKRRAAHEEQEKQKRIKERKARETRRKKADARKEAAEREMLSALKQKYET